MARTTRKGSDGKRFNPVKEKRLAMMARMTPKQKAHLRKQEKAIRALRRLKAKEERKEKALEKMVYSEKQQRLVPKSSGVRKLSKELKERIRAKKKADKEKHRKKFLIASKRKPPPPPTAKSTSPTSHKRVRLSNEKKNFNYWVAEARCHLRKNGTKVPPQPKVGNILHSTATQMFKKYQSDSKK